MPGPTNNSYDESNPIPVIITDGVTPIAIAPGPYLPIIETSHWRIHLKQHYTVSDMSDSVNTANPKIIRFSIPASPENYQYHWTCNVYVSAESKVELLENPILSTPGTEIISVNNNRMLPLSVSNVTVYKDSTISTDGTILMTLYSPGGTKSSVVGGESGHTEELLYGSDKEYVIRVTPYGNGTKINIIFFWYEFLMEGA